MITRQSTNTPAKLFKRNRPVINRIIRGHLAKTGRGVVHGTRATNAQLPRDLNVRTTDWDIKSRNPLLSALRLEKKLDKRFGGDFFRTEAGATRRLSVHKVKSNITDETFADFSLRENQMPTVAKRGVKFATLRDQVERARNNIKDANKAFRRAKDLSLIRRFNIFKNGRRVK